MSKLYKLHLSFVCIGIGLCQPIFVSVARFHSRMDHGTENAKLDVLFSLSPGLTVVILKP